jgi:hypothetical protein
MSSDVCVAEGWVVIEPATVFASGKVATIKVVKATQRRPTLTDDQRAIKLKLRVPVAAWGALADVEINVPLDFLSAPAQVGLEPGS